MADQTTMTTTTTTTTAPPPPISVLFARGVLARLATWPILKVALQHHWGGPDGESKYRWLAGEIVDAFEASLPPPPPPPPPPLPSSSSTLSSSTTTTTSKSKSKPKPGQKQKAAAPEPDDIYIEEMLLQVMADEFETVVEDGSGEEIARDVVLLWGECKEGKDGLVREWEEREERTKGRRVEVELRQGVQEEEGDGDGEEWADEDDEDEDEEDSDVEMAGDEVPTLIDSQMSKRNEPEVDEDGFTLVKRR